MVYVFGVDIPIMELLLVYSALSFAGVLLILWEIARLRKLILLEREDIELLESSKKADNEDAVTRFKYSVKNLLKHGFKEEEIRENAVKKGWPEKKVDNVLKEIKKEDEKLAKVK